MLLDLKVDTGVEGGIEGKTVKSSLSEAQILSLAVKQYADPLGSAYTELVSNALDAHKVAGCYDTPIEITFEQDTVGKVIHVTIRDFGEGMTAAFLRDHYFSLGHSTKREDANQTGAFGLGAKAGLIISPVMRVVVYDGSSSTTVLGQLSGGTKIVVSEPTVGPSEEKRGTAVTLSVPISDDFYLAKRAARSSPKAPIESEISPRVLGMVRQLTIIGHNAGLDNCPKVRVISDSSEIDDKWYSSQSNDSVRRVLERMTSLHRFVNRVKVGVLRIDGMTLIATERKGDTGNSYWTRFDTSAVIWQDSRYAIPSTMVEGIFPHKLNGGQQTLAIDIRGMDMIIDCPPTMQFEISSDRQFIRDTPGNRDLLREYIRNSLTKLRKLVSNSGERFDSRSLALENPFDKEGQDIAKEWYTVNQFKKIFTGMEAEKSLYRNMVKSLDGVCDCRQLVYDRHGYSIRKISPWRTKYGGDRSDTHALAYDSVDAPVILIVPYRKPNAAAMYLAAVKDGSRPLTVLMIVCDDDSDSAVSDVIAKVKPLVPSCVHLVDVATVASQKGISLKNRRSYVKKVDDNEPIITPTDPSKKIFYTARDTYADLHSMREATSIDQDMRDAFRDYKISMKKVLIVPVKGFGVDWPVSINEASLVTVGRLFKLPVLFYRGGVRFDKLDTKGIELVAMEDFILELLGEHMENAVRILRRFELFQLRKTLLGYRELVEKHTGKELPAFLKQAINLDYRKTRLFLAEKRLPQDMPEVETNVGLVAQALAGDNRFTLFSTEIGAASTFRHEFEHLAKAIHTVIQWKGTETQLALLAKVKRRGSKDLLVSRITRDYVAGLCLNRSGLVTMREALVLRCNSLSRETGLTPPINVENKPLNRRWYIRMLETQIASFFAR